MKYPERTEQIKKWTAVVFGLAMTALFTMLTLAILNVIPIDCEDWFSLPYLFPMAVMALYTAISVVFGSSLIKLIDENRDSVEQPP